KQPGVQVSRAGSGHHTVTLNGNRVATIPTSPSDIRALANCRAELRRAGISLDPTSRRATGATTARTPTHTAATSEPLSAGLVPPPPSRAVTVAGQPDSTEAVFKCASPDSVST